MQQVLLYYLELRPPVTTNSRNGYRRLSPAGSAKLMAFDYAELYVEKLPPASPSTSGSTYFAVLSDTDFREFSEHSCRIIFISAAGIFLSSRSCSGVGCRAPLTCAVELPP